ncbi:hypothetical protein SAMN05660748_1247 [Blastococcus aggregatus]|uniref:Uncharacterized protein n=1 Tax=Blastococcus aggregatus TaxID=38502 RepID=A0A285V7R4_9ACTN|nr:hypothetical protein [Blastococcus aggregatus]SOC48551.1 hypothetical protein SAMN05660748_1247 [Blastococcus aggregatus]
MVDALHWIAERRPLVGGIRSNALLTALVAAADAGLTGAGAALREASRAALSSTFDTSADLLATDTIVAPHRYDRALAEVAGCVTTGSLVDIAPEAVEAAQSANPDVVETLGLVAGLSWRDLRDRAAARGVPLPGKATGPWKNRQIKTVFEIVDEVVTGRGQPQLLGAVASRPLELLLGLKGTGWAAVEAFRTAQVTYGTLLAQRDVGSAWSAHRNRTNNEISRLMVMRLLEALDAAGVAYWSTDGNSPVAKTFLAGKAVKEGRTLGQLSVVTRDAGGRPRYAILIAVARDGGTARRSAATVLKLPGNLVLPGVAVLLGTGWSERGESDDLIRAFEGRVYTERGLTDLAAMATDQSDPAGIMTNSTSGQERS